MNTILALWLQLENFLEKPRGQGGQTLAEYTVKVATIGAITIIAVAVLFHPWNWFDK